MKKVTMRRRHCVKEKGTALLAGLLIFGSEKFSN